MNSAKFPRPIFARILYQLLVQTIKKMCSNFCSIEFHIYSEMRKQNRPLTTRRRQM